MKHISIVLFTTQDVEATFVKLLKHGRDHLVHLAQDLRPRRCSAECHDCEVVVFDLWWSIYNAWMCSWSSVVNRSARKVHRVEACYGYVNNIFWKEALMSMIVSPRQRGMKGGTTFRDEACTRRDVTSCCYSVIYIDQHTALVII